MIRVKNVFGEFFQFCCIDLMIGFYWDGVCNIGLDDFGMYVVCVEMIVEFLFFIKLRGNDFSILCLEYCFFGFKFGDGWCLCVL